MGGMQHLGGDFSFMMAASDFFSSFFFVTGVLLSFNRSAVLSCSVVLQCSKDAGFRFQIRCRYHP